MPRLLWKALAAPSRKSRRLSLSDLVNLSELGRRLGHNKGYIHKLKSRGVLAFGEDGLIDLDAAISAIAASRDPAKQHMKQVNDRQRDKSQVRSQPSELDVPPPALSNASFMKAQTARAMMDFKLKEVAYKRETGELVDRKRVESMAFTIARGLRDAVLGLPTRMAPELAGMTEPFEIEARLRSELRQVFEDWSKMSVDDLDRALDKTH